MIPHHFNSNGLPPISDNYWLWIKTDSGELRKVKRIAILKNKDQWDWDCVTIEGYEQTFKVKSWAYS